MKTLLVDSHFLCHRAKHSFANKDVAEDHNGVLIGFMKQVKDLARIFETNKFLFFWDTKGSKRKEVYPEYKEKRNAAREELSEAEKIWNASCFRQFDIVRGPLLRSFGFKNIYWQDKFETDDLIAKVVISRPALDCVMVTRDNDFLQLLEYADMFDPINRTLITQEIFEEMYKIGSHRWAEVKAIAGCKSDNVEGLMGVGETTAIQYLTCNPKLKKHHAKYKAIVSEKGQKIIERNLPLVTLPYPETKLYKIQDDVFSLSSFEKTSKKYGLIWSKQDLSFWRGFMEGLT